MFGTITMNIPDKPGSYPVVLGNRPVGDDFSYPMSYFFGKQFTYLTVNGVPIGTVRDIRIDGDKMVGVWDYNRHDKHQVWELKRDGALKDQIEIRLASIKNDKAIRRPDQPPIRLVTIDVGVKG